MKPSESLAAAKIRRHTNPRHAFVIGPLCDSKLSSRKARLYYCRLCNWTFLVCGSQVAVLDERGEPLIGEESFSRFCTFEEGPCPALEAFAPATLADDENPRLSLRRKYDELSHLASSHFPVRPDRPGPLLRVLGGLRENLGRRS
jgi:hypothetical protein